MVACRFGEVLYALRRLRGSPGFAIGATLTMAIAIGATASVFSVVDGVLLKGISVPEPGPRAGDLREQSGNGAPGVLRFASGLPGLSNAEHRVQQSRGVLTDGFHRHRAARAGARVGQRHDAQPIRRPRRHAGVGTRVGARLRRTRRGRAELWILAAPLLAGPRPSSDKS